jgi:hypothetical protein
MPRRAPYTEVIKEGQVREDHVKGMGDVLYKGFQCLNPKCTHFIFIRKDTVLLDEFEFQCPVCHFTFKSGEETKFYDYKLMDLRDGSVFEEGEFAVLHDDYLKEAKEFKYCIVCNTIKPTELFDVHTARKSGRQGECNLCKGLYNSIKNQTRTSDQHREAAQKRRMYLDLSGQAKIDSEAIYKRFEFKCFVASVQLVAT